MIYATEVRERVLLLVRGGKTDLIIAREMGISLATIGSWRRQNGLLRPRATRKPKTGDFSVVSFPPAKGEAAACLRMAQVRGEIERMRETIRVTPEHVRELHTMGLSTALIHRAVGYRQQVLRFFDEMVRKSERRPKISPHALNVECTLAPEVTT